jgi:protease-4
LFIGNLYHYPYYYRIEKDEAMRITRLCGLCALTAAIAGCGPTGFKITPIPIEQDLQETMVMGDRGWVSDRVLIVDVSGVLAAGDSILPLSLREDPVNLFSETLEKAVSDSRIRAVVLRINSPGGTVTTTEIMAGELKRFKERVKERNVPVVAVIMEVGASGAYYLACGADRIIAHQSAVTGSIGVMMQMVTVEGVLQKLGVRTDAIKSGPRKDAGSPFRSMTADERGDFQRIVDQFYSQFLEAVDQGRPDLDSDRIEQLADGRIYTGADALEAGLIDEVGTLRDGVKRAKELAGIKKAKVVVFHRPLAHRGSIYAVDDAPQPTVNIVNVDLPKWLRPGRAQFLYLWAPASGN